MDNYQKRFARYFNFTGLSTDEVSKGVRYYEQPEKIELKQDDDITLTKYNLGIRAIDRVIEQISVVKSNQTECLPFTLEDIPGKLLKYRNYALVLDFEDRIDAIEFRFYGGFANPLRIQIEYIEADKKAYHEKQENLKRTELIAAMNVSHRTGQDLVNIYWRHASPEVEITKIDLYVKDENEKMKIASYSCDNETMFKSIGGLAFGDYEYQLAQYHKDNRLIAQTDLIPFRL